MTERRDIKMSITPLAGEQLHAWHDNRDELVANLKRCGYVEAAHGVWYRPGRRERWWADRRLYAALALIAAGAIAAWIILAAGR